MIGSIFRTCSALFSSELRSLFWRSIGLTVLVLIVTGGALVALFERGVSSTSFVATYPWIEIYLVFLTGFGIFALGLYLLPAISMLVSGFFLDDVAGLIEARDYPNDRRGTPMTTGSALIESVRFFLITLAANLFALIFLFVPGVNIVFYFVMNAFLLGREYFYLVAGRHQSRGNVVILYRSHRSVIMIAGMAISVFVFIPILNLLTPLFATILMVHVYKAATRSTD